jgi:low temperature requirement protein LtrA
LATLDLVERARAALRGYGYWHMPMLWGIVAIAAAERGAFTSPLTALSWFRAGLLGGGVAAFLVGDALFRRELEIGRGSTRALAAAAALATLPLGALTTAAAQVAALVALLAASILLEARSLRTGAPKLADRAAARL